jgi:hypothetical protein
MTLWPDLERDRIDLFGVRDVVMTELGADVVAGRDVPGISVPCDEAAL